MQMSVPVASHLQQPCKLSTFEMLMTAARKKAALKIDNTYIVDKLRARENGQA